MDNPLGGVVVKFSLQCAGMGIGTIEGQGRLQGRRRSLFVAETMMSQRGEQVILRIAPLLEVLFEHQ